VDVGKKIQENPLITRRKLALGSLRSLMNIDRLSVFGRSENDQRKKLVTVNERYARKRAILNAIFKPIFKFNDFVYPVKTAASSEMKREKRGKNAHQRVKKHHLQRGHRNLSKHRNCDTRTVAFTNMRRARARVRRQCGKIAVTAVNASQWRGARRARFQSKNGCYLRGHASHGE